MNKFIFFLVLVSTAHRCFADVQDDRLTNDLGIIVAERVPLVPAVKMPNKVKVPAPLKDIAGGHEANIEDFPYQVSLFVNGDYCGGFIVSEDYIVTAAHCPQGAEPSKLDLRAGSTYRKNGTIIPISEVYVHPEYNHPEHNKDVAVLKTTDKIQFSDTIKAIPLASEGRALVVGSMIVISGWGKTWHDAPTTSERILYVDIPVVDHVQCELVYPTLLTNYEFCGGYFSLGGQGTCKGDSGNAAVQDGVAVGIVSYAVGCGQPLFPSVFVDIAAKPIRDFIKEKTGL